MNVLDENVTRDQIELLHRWGIKHRALVRDLGFQGMSDENVLPLLLTLKTPTFLTRDEDFFNHRLTHHDYSLVWLDVLVGETAFFIRKFLRHPDFRTSHQRLGKVIRVHDHAIEYYESNSPKLTRVLWL